MLSSVCSLGRSVELGRQAAGDSVMTGLGWPTTRTSPLSSICLSLLHRLGPADAALSLGNKKAVDITVVRAEGGAVTIDVKGVAGRYD